MIYNDLVSFYSTASTFSLMHKITDFTFVQCYFMASFCFKGVSVKIWHIFCPGLSGGGAGLPCLQGHRCVLEIDTTVELSSDYNALGIIIPQSVSYLSDALVFRKMCQSHPWYMQH